MTKSRTVNTDQINTTRTSKQNLTGITGSQLNNLNHLEDAGQGFFSGTTFNVNVMASQGFGKNALQKLIDVNTAVALTTIDADAIPFRILFFDNMSANNGLYVVSGDADYRDGALTALNTHGNNIYASNSPGYGKHTIIKGFPIKGYEITLADINII